MSKHHPIVDHVYGLNAMELRIVRAIAQGRDSIGAGAVVSLSVHTVRDYLRKIFAKMGCYSQLSMCLRAERAGLLKDIEV